MRKVISRPWLSGLARFNDIGFRIFLVRFLEVLYLLIQLGSDGLAFFYTFSHLKRPF
jgi:hypothetical protein